LIKNIENVQGDERDVIIFSVAVGPDKNWSRDRTGLLAQRRRWAPPQAMVTTFDGAALKMKK
jgi:hypothetical protein